MEVDRAWAQEHLRCNVSVREALGDEAGDAELLRRQPCRCFWLGSPGVLAARPEFGPRTLRPLAGAERVEGLERRAQMLAGIDPAPVPAQELAVDE